MGNGVDFVMHAYAWHGKTPNDEQLATALAQIQKPLEIINHNDLKHEYFYRSGKRYKKWFW